MPGDTAIGWADKSWNPVTGCDEVSDGCIYCYARPLAEDMQKRGTKRYQNGFQFTVHPESLNYPLTVKKPSRFFVNSMSDIGHGLMSQDFFNAIMDTISLCPQHIFQLLTKRPDNLYRLLAKWASKFPQGWSPESGQSAIPPHVWVGVSVENSDPRVLRRIDVLRRIPAKIRFLSVEPLISDVHTLDMQGISWVIVGGESGPNFRPMNLDWVRSVRDQCVKAGIAFFYKQGAGRYPGQNRMLDGRTWDEFPVYRRVET